MSADEEHELREFCETSSWETTSAASEEDQNSGAAAGRSAAYGSQHQQRGAGDYNNRKASQINGTDGSGPYGEESENSSQSVQSDSDKWNQARWEDNECTKFHKKWRSIEKEI